MGGIIYKHLFAGLSLIVWHTHTHTHTFFVSLLKLFVNTHVPVCMVFRVLEMYTEAETSDGVRLTGG